MLQPATIDYTPDHDWQRLPDGLNLVEAPGVAVDSADNVFLLTRNVDHPVMVFDSGGAFRYSFGAGVFTNRTHGIFVSHDDHVYCVDDGSHVVTKFSAAGELLLEIGTRDAPSERFSGAPFNRPTDVAVLSDGSIYVSDGYGNARVHRYSPEGRLLSSWGEPGIDAGQFLCPHNIAADSEGYVYVADREAHRIQVFDHEGQFVLMANNIHRPAGLCIGSDGNIYVAELCGIALVRDAPGVGHRLSILDRKGRLLARYGSASEGEGDGEFVAPHGVAVDSNGFVYVSEVSYAMCGSRLSPPREMRSLSKLAPV